MNLPTTLEGEHGPRARVFEKRPRQTWQVADLEPSGTKAELRR